MKIIIYSIICMVSVTSCKQKLTDAEKREKAKQEAQQKTDAIAAPLIANDIGDLNIMLAQIENKTQSLQTRLYVYDELIKKFPEYLHEAKYYTLSGKCQLLKEQLDDVDHLDKHPNTVENWISMHCDTMESRMAVDSVINFKFQTAVKYEKEYIKKKWTTIAAAQVYKEALQKQIEAEQAVEQEKRK